MQVIHRIKESWQEQENVYTKIGKMLCCGVLYIPQPKGYSFFLHDYFSRKEKGIEIALLYGNPVMQAEDIFPLSRPLSTLFLPPEERKRYEKHVDMDDMAYERWQEVHVKGSFALAIISHLPVAISDNNIDIDIAVYIHKADAYAKFAHIVYRRVRRWQQYARRLDIQFHNLP